jgi:hypothetical protein
MNILIDTRMVCDKLSRKECWHPERVSIKNGGHGSSNTVENSTIQS